MNKIVLISAKQGGGKTTLASSIRKALFLGKNSIVCEDLIFADGIYDIHNFARSYMTGHGFPPPKEKSEKDGDLLQYLGTDWARKTYGENVWCDLIKKKAAKIFYRTSWAKHSVVIVSDCRFINEFDCFPGSLKIRLECDREIRKARCSQWRDKDSHQSEVDLDNYSARGNFDLKFDSGKLSIDEITKKVIKHLIEILK